MGGFRTDIIVVVLNLTATGEEESSSYESYDPLCFYIMYSYIWSNFCTYNSMDITAGEAYTM